MAGIEIHDVNVHVTDYASDDVDAIVHDGEFFDPLHEAITPEDLSLSSISDPDIRSLFDPRCASVNMASIINWSDDKIAAVIQAIKPEHVAVIDRKFHLIDPFHVTPRILSFHDLTWIIKSNEKSVKLLDGVSGMIIPGTVCGVLGGPDSGVTPLLSLLANSDVPRSSTVAGQVLYDGKEPQNDFNRQVGFAVKQDNHIAALTVYETLYFSGRLRLPSYYPHKLVHIRVLIILKLLGLSHVANSPVGDAIIRGISGGEKRRLGFGVELVAGLSVLIADLPTNGLDSASAYGLIRTMRFVCRGGSSLVASLVQPSTELFELLDVIILLAKGRVLYQGAPSLAEAYFLSHGFVRPKSKNVPQFLEELSAKPELFYQASVPSSLSLFTKPSKNELAAVTVAPAPAPAVASTSSANSSVSKRRRAAWKLACDAYRNSDMYNELIKDMEEVRHGDAHTLHSFAYKRIHAKVANSSGNHNAAHEIAAVTAPVKGDSLEVPSVRQFEFSPSPQPESSSSSSSSSSSAGAAGADGHAADVPSLPEQLARRVASSSANTWLMKAWYQYYSSSPWTQFKCNLSRQWTLTRRNKGLWRDDWLISLLIGFVTGTLFYNLSYDEQGVRNRAGLYFYLLSLTAFNAVQIVPVLSSQRQVFYDQTALGFYASTAYFLSLWLIQIPLVLVESAALIIPVWGLANLNGDDFASGQFWYGYLLLFLNSLISRTWMLLLFAISPNEIYADVLNQVTNILFTKLCGYFIPQNSIVASWYWVYVISYFTYPFAGFLINDLVDHSSGCNPNVDLNCMFGSSATGLDVIYGIDPTQNKWDFVWKSVLFLIFFTFGALLVFKFVNWAELDSPELPNWGESESDGEAQSIGGVEQPASASVISVRRGRGVKESDKMRSHIVIDRQAHNRASMSKSPSSKSNERANMFTVTQQALGQLKKRIKEGQTEYYDHNEKGQVQEQGQVQAPEQAHAADSVHYRHAVKYVDTSDRMAGVKGATLVFHNLDYVVPYNGGKRQLLTKCYGFARPGNMVALMGASGAGKSTLLDVLAGKKTGGSVTGTLLIDGKPRDHTFAQIAGYVEQFDSHNPHSTVREAILFSGRLRLPASTSDAELSRRVDDTLALLGLSHLANEMIGGPGMGGVSQEVRKKVTIGTELIMQPRLLFLDEPTTGLDSAGAFAIMSAVRNLARHISVLCTIHQPSSEIVGMFDSLLLMKPGGRVVYYAPVTHVPAYFKEHHFGDKECGESQNIADFALDAIKKTDIAYVPNGGVDMASVFRNSIEGKQVAAECFFEMKKGGASLPRDAELIIDEVTKWRQFQAGTPKKTGVDDEEKADTESASSSSSSSPSPSPSPSPSLAEDTSFGAPLSMNVGGGPITPWLVQLSTLLTRFWRTSYRDELVLGVRMFLSVFMGFVVGTVFYRLGFSQVSADARISAIFLTLLYLMFTGNMFLPEIFNARPMYFRETTSNAYSASAYYVARFIADIPWVLSECSVLAIMIYFLCNFHPSSSSSTVFVHFIQWWLALIGVRFTSIAATWFIGTAIENANNANTIHSTYFNLLFVFTGFLIPKPAIPAPWQWFSDINYLLYALSYLTANEVTGESFTCTPSETVRVAPGYNACDYSSVPQPPSSNTSSSISHAITKCYYQCGADITTTFGVPSSEPETSGHLAVLYTFFVAFFILGFLALKYINHIHR